MDNDREDRFEILKLTVRTKPYDLIDCLLHAWELTEHEAFILLSMMLCRTDDPPKSLLCRLVSRVRLK